MDFEPKFWTEVQSEVQSHYLARLWARMLAEGWEPELSGVSLTAYHKKVIPGVRDGVQEWVVTWRRVRPS